MKRKAGALLLTTLLCLLPIGAGLLLWDHLPEQVPSHWNLAGEVDGYSTRQQAVFFMPALMAGTHLLVQILLQADPRRENMSRALRAVLLWLLPLMSNILCGISYMVALGVPVRVEAVVPFLIGVLFIVIGNYLPKCQQNYTMGIRTPWALHDPENWAKTHRMGGWCFCAGGVLLLLCALPGLSWLLLPAILVTGLLPCLYSYLLYRKKKRAGL